MPLRFLNRVVILIASRLLIFSPSTMACWILRLFKAKVGRNVRILSPLVIHDSERDYSNLVVGDNVFINENCFIDLSEKVILEEGVSLAPNVSIMTHNRFNDNHFLEARLKDKCGKKKVVIKAGAGIKVGACVLMGVTIGKNSVIAAGAVVTRDVPDNTIAMGVPAKPTYDILKQRNIRG